MKQEYLEPRIVISFLKVNDIIRTSAGKDEFDDGWTDPSIGGNS